MVKLQYIVGKARQFCKNDDLYPFPNRAAYCWAGFRSKWGLSSWRNFRRELFRRLSSACGVQLGHVSPWYLILIGCILFPSSGLQYLCEKIVPIGYDICSDSFRVGKHRFDRWFLEDLAGFPKGTVFRIVENDGKHITIERIN
jgi:hypothetical protein